MENREQFSITKGPETQEYLTEHSVIVETPEAKFRIVYGKHDLEQQPEDIGNPDALALEFVANYSTFYDAIGAFAAVRSHKQYKEISKKAQNERIPIFLVDMGKDQVVTTLQLGLRMAEPIMGLLLLVNLTGDILEDAASKKEFTRRDFLKKSLKGLSSIYFLTHLGPSQARSKRQINERTARRAIDRFLFELNEKIHPETESIITTFRNYLIAQKLKTIGEKQFNKQEMKPEITLVIGAGHTGIEKALQETDEERKELIEKFMKLPGLEQVQESITSIARFDYVEEVENQTRWKVTIFKEEHQGDTYEEGTFLAEPAK